MSPEDFSWEDNVILKDVTTGIDLKKAGIKATSDEFKVKVATIRQLNGAGDTEDMLEQKFEK